jgi:hypothetical protein
MAGDRKALEPPKRGEPKRYTFEAESDEQAIEIAQALLEALQDSTPKH